MSSVASGVTILGSGTLVPHAQRASPAHLIEAAGVRMLLDCGTGTVHGFARHEVPWQDLTHVAITHFHNDHVGDLPALLWALKHGLRPPRAEPLVLIGPPGFRSFVEGLAGALGAHVTDPGFPVDVQDLAPGSVFRGAGAAFSLKTHPTPHTEESVAYRWEGDEGVVAYTGDTGPSEELAHFLRGAEVLISECALTDPPEMNAHLSPAGVAVLAGVARPRTLVLTHVFPPLTPQEAVRQVKAAGYPHDVVAAHDGLRIPLGMPAGA